ncbi:MAG: winged helix-turn-helix domain-containing protein [Verrucomicrobiaceae bacterium]|nr:winged helix-turn-helix domain-containing protein [Verrucomicrobiaceae bacterium]
MNAYPTTRTVDNFISALRAKIEPEPGLPVYLLTAHGQGYLLMTTA